MTFCHPASLLFLWLAVLALASTARLPWLALAAGCFVLVAALTASRHLVRLLRRSRWLLLTLFLLFGWMTPGTPFAPLPGASVEGLREGGEHVLRLVAALGLLALLLRACPPVALVAGLRTLLAPFAVFGFPRDRLAVRLALTLEAVEQGDLDPVADRLALPAHTPGVLDATIVSVGAGLLVWAVAA